MAPLPLLFNYKNKNWLQFLFIVKTAVLKQQISKFYPQIQRIEIAITFISVSGLS